MSAAFSAISPAGHAPDPVHQGDADILHILVVDDSSAIRELLAAKLKDLAVDSFRVDIDLAESGEDALAQARQKAYDLVFLDVEMPGIGGLEACRKLKATSSARVAMLSGMKSAEAHDAGRAAGCDNYLTKPPHDADIRSILRLVSLRKLTST
jgi:CheY-like chemotaxis protein